MERPNTDPKAAAVWAAGEASADAALVERLTRAGLNVRREPAGCQLAVIDFRSDKGAPLLATLRADAATRDMLVLGLVSDSPEGFRTALEAGADAFVCWERLELEAPFRLQLLLRRHSEREAAIRHERDLAALIDLTSDYARTRDVTELLHKVTRRLADELGILRAALVLFDEERVKGRILAASDEARSDREVELSQYPELREVAKTGQPLLLPDAPTHPLLDPVKERLKAIGAIAALPLASQGRVMGALLLRTGEARRTFSPREMAFATTVAHATAVALRNARVLERAEAKLASLTQYQGFFKAFFHGIAVLGDHGEVVSLNPAGARLLGVEGEEGAAAIIKNLSPAANEAVQELLHRTRAGEARQEIDIPVDLPGDRKVTLAISAAMLGTDSGQGLEHAVIVCFRDVTQARAIQAELRKTNEFMERLIDQASDAIIAADMRGTVIVFNRGAERICGYTAEQAIGTLNVRDLYPAGVAKELMAKIRSKDHGGKNKLDPTRAEIVSRAGERVPVSMTAALITEELGGVSRDVATVGIFSDLRDRMRLEATLTQTQEKLQQTERAALIAELAGTAAHELNQPLTSIMGYSELLRRRLPAGDPAARSIDIIYREAERMAEIVRKIGKITRYETKAYVGESRIVDLDRAAGEDDA
ncbi:MAG: PAS domain S-box protein [Deltaproteobacteria bacterium]|nr:PAS domain S-box protein [Deltaproteobacteria bacterium]